jgi:AcrR family transcriptional regulator
VSNRLSRQKVIDWAIRVANKEGVEAVTLTRIANDLGVSQPALYRHVGGIDDMRKAFALRARDLLAGDLLESTSGATGKEAIRALANAWRRGGSFRPGLIMLPGQVRALGDEELEASIERVVVIIRKALATLDLDEDSSLHAALLVRSALHGFSALENSSGDPPEHFNEAFEQLITLIWIGLQEMQEVPSGQHRRHSDPAPEGGENAAPILGAQDDSIGSGRSKGGARKGSSRNTWLTPDDVVETAARVAEEHGPAAISITRIARELGVRQSALYRHVDGVEALLQALALRAQRSLLSRITRAGIGRARDEALSAVAVAWRSYVHEQPGAYSSLSQVVTDRDPVLEQSSDDISGVLELALRGYALSPERTAQVATCVRSTLHGFCLLEKDGGYPGPYDVDENFDRLIRLLIAGIRGLETPNAPPAGKSRGRESGKTGRTTHRREVAS